MTTVQAMITGDGAAVHIGTRQEVHPVYGTPSFELHARLPLGTEEVALYQELTAHGTGFARLHIRSALAQLGLDAFHPSCAASRLHEGELVIETLITAFNGETGYRVIDRMRELIASGASVRVMHAGLFPHVSRVATAEDVRALVGGGELDINGADIYADGSVGLVPASPLYRLREGALTAEAIDAIVTGPGRASLLSLWSAPGELPPHIASKEFLVTGVGVHTRDHHVVLRREVLTGGEHAEVVHGESCILQAGRTRGGARQLELWNRNGKVQPTAELRVVADLYRAAEVAEPGH